jgi:hypothetical protein
MGRVRISAEQRRRRLVRRHLLDRSGTSPRHVVNALVAVHATDPATPYLSILARTRDVTIEEIAAAMYDHRLLVRWLAMRRTVFLLDRDMVPDVHAAVSGPLSDVLRRRLITTLEKNEALPEVSDVPTWVRNVEEGVRAAILAAGVATGAQLSAAEPRLKTPIPPRVTSDTKQTVTSSLLTMMGAAGEIVRSTPVGAWTTRQHRWQPVDAWWDGGVPLRDAGEARVRLARRWLESYGPATADDLQWWTGWTKTATHAALTALRVVNVDLDGVEGIDLPDVHDGDGDIAAAAGVAALLPSLDSTAMGWRHRQWYSPDDTRGLYDRRGNIGPTIWWDGRIVGVWASTRERLRTRILEDIGAEGTAAITAAAADLERRLGGTIITPSIRAPLERDLS